MQAIEFVTTEDRFVISIDKKLVEKAIILLFMQRLWLEYFAQIIDFDDSILDFGEEIKENWWTQNQDRLLKRMQI